MGKRFRGKNLPGKQSAPRRLRGKFRAGNMEIPVMASKNSQKNIFLNAGIEKVGMEGLKGPATGPETTAHESDTIFLIYIPYIKSRPPGSIPRRIGMAFPCQAKTGVL